jgi:hypothetical protein
MYIIGVIIFFILKNYILIYKMDSSNIAPKKRLEIYKISKKYVQQKDERSMDDICISRIQNFNYKLSRNFI